MNLYDFVQYSFRKDYGFSYDKGEHLKQLCEQLEQVYYGNIVNLHIAIPPRYGATEILKRFIIWTTLKELKPCEVVWCAETKERSMLDIETIEKWTPRELLKVAGTVIGGTTVGKGAGKMRTGWGGCIIVDSFDTQCPRDELDRATKWIENSLLPRRIQYGRTPVIIVEHGTELRSTEMLKYLAPVYVTFPVLVGDKPLWESRHSLELLKKLENHCPDLFNKKYLLR